MESMVLLLVFLLSIPGSYSVATLQRSYRALQFQPSMLDFQEQPVGVPEVKKVYLNNPSSEESVILISISAETSHFYTSFFQNRIIPPGGNTSFDVVFHTQIVGNVENTLFINTSQHGMFTYQVFGVGVPDPYRLRPFTGCRGPLNSNFSPLADDQNPCREPLQVVAMHAGPEDIYLDLPTGQKNSGRTSWEIPSPEAKMVMKSSITSQVRDNHTGFIRIKTRSSNSDKFIILPVVMKISTGPGLYVSKEVLDFGTLRSQDPPKQMNIHFINLGTKDVPIKSIKPTPANKAVTVDFKPITVKAGENAKVATIIFHASKAQGSPLSGKITVKANKESDLEIPYKVEVFNGYLWFDHTATLFHIRDSLTEPVKRTVLISSTYDFPVLVHNISLPEEAKTMFDVKNFSLPTLIPPHESHYLLTLYFWPVKPSNYINSNILLTTNASQFYLPIRAFTGFLEALVLPPSLDEHQVDFGVLRLNKTASIMLVVINSNPTEMEIRSWMVTGDRLSIELLRFEPGNKTTALSRIRELQNASASYQKNVILPSRYYAVFRVTLLGQEHTGMYNEAVHITSDYEILTIPVKATTVVGTLTSSPKQIVLPMCFPGKVVRQSLSVVSSFSESMKQLHMHCVTDDERFYYRRLKNSKTNLEPRQKSKIANIYFDASLDCRDQCYVGLPFLLKSCPFTMESSSYGLFMQENLWSSDADLHQTLLERWRSLKENSWDKVEAIFEMSTALQGNIQTKVSAQMVWPSIISSSHQIIFPLTLTHNSSVVKLLLKNPTDVSVYIQILPIALYPNSTILVKNLVDRKTLVNFPSINPNTLEFHVETNHTTLNRTVREFEECPAQPLVCNALLLHGEDRSFDVKFTPVSNHTVTSLLIIRNNLTVMDHVLVQGRGASESLKVAGKPAGPKSILRFKITESLLKHCTERVKPKQNFTLRKTFKVENTGELTILIKSIEISEHTCEGYGFKVVNCQEFELKPKASRDIVILFTPDFSTSRSAAELRLVTAGGSEFLFTLNASLPYHMLMACSEDSPRPSWELELYIIVSFIMSFMFLLVMAVAYLAAQGIWEPFKRQICSEGSDTPVETERQFVLSDVAQKQMDLNRNEETSQNSTQGMNDPSSSSLGISSQPCSTQPETQSKALTNLDGLRSRIVNKAKVSFSRSFRPSQQQLSSSSMEWQTTMAAMLHKDHPTETPKAYPETRTQSEGKPSHGSTSPHFSSFTEAVNKDLGHPNASPDKLQSQQTLLPSAPNKGSGTKRKVQTKPQIQDNQKEKEQKTKGKLHGEKSKNTLTSQEDSSSTPNIDAVDVMKSKPLMVQKEKVDGTAASPPKYDKKKRDSSKANTTDVNSNSLELPCVTALEIKQREQLAAKSMKPPVPAKGPQTKQTEKVPCEKSEQCRLYSVEKAQCDTALSEPGNSNSVDEESDSSLPPEWDSVPVQPANSGDDSLYEISMQTMNADHFLKSSNDRTFHPPATSACLVAQGTERTPGSNKCSSNTLFKRESVNKNKLTKSISLPDKCNSPTPSIVAANYDKSPGGGSPVKGMASKETTLGNMALPHDKSIWSYGSNSAGLWNPFAHSNNNSLNSSQLTFESNDAFTVSGGQEQQLKWSELNAVSPSIWESTSSGPLHPWPITSSSSAHPSESVLGTSSSIWSTTTPFSSSIWSPSFTSSNTTALSHLNTSPNNSYPNPQQDARLVQPLEFPPCSEMGATYSLWSMWGLTPNRRSSEPWSTTSTADHCPYFTH